MEQETVRQSPEEYSDEKSDSFQPVLVWQRWFMLLIFASVSMLNAFQWLHLNIITDSVIYFWQGSLPDGKYNQNVAIAWLSMLYMLSYIPLIIPVTWLLGKRGLRVSILLGAVLNALGAWIKCVSLELAAPVGTSGIAAASSFGVLVLGQTVCSISQVFLLGIPAHISGVWFGQNELAMATAFGVFGNQVGVALGFGIPPLIVPAVDKGMDPFNNVEHFDEFKQGFQILLYGGAAIISLDFFIVAIFFKREPAVAPSRAQHTRLMQRQSQQELEGIKGDNTSKVFDTQSSRVSFTDNIVSMVSVIIHQGYKDSCIRLFKNCGFILLNICYGMNTGIYHAISTILSVVLLEHYPTESIAIGWIGFTMVIAGLIGSIVAGIALERTRKYRLILILFYLMSVVSFGAFIGSIYSKQIGVIFFTMFLLGFFQSGFLPLGFEYAAEITYPENEGLSSGILNTSAHIIGIVITYVSTYFVDRFGGLYATIFMLACMAVAAIPTLFLKDDLKRQKAQEKITSGAESEANEESEWNSYNVDNKTNSLL